MKKWVTEITAIDPHTRELKKWLGPYITAPTMEAATLYCQKNGLGYCEVTGQLISEIPCKENSYTPDWVRRVDFDNLN
ncbi:MULTISPECIES: hypothetical protein [Olivibacter]|jgi:hypothetical protein|uniref:Uncharacterized protein n=3 Tax=Sphingobacteriaceae TaxID=84566 RepID=F4C2I9_SPHS2|nr:MULTISPECIES: hypothetical protein [Olivibacter]MCL4638947.1 hypothetical protein [Olivibacter sp. UJ_SKK_5.1]MDM8175461.1 hypothetical protein [Olivibacter sp. 47]MDX3914072.1 hypothetical protein [Pseudosphingobacterium sp.]QEL02217.1 hypothetical protein FKG96_15835 [Olivibacter sp. LS-1]